MKPDQQINQAIRKLLDGIASGEEVDLLKQRLATREISIGGNVSRSVIIIGSGNTVELTPQALDLLGGHHLLGNLDRDLTEEEIASGLNRFELELPLRAPILMPQFQEMTHRLRPLLTTNIKSLSDQARKERLESIAIINSLCMDALDISFNALCLGEEPPNYDARSPFRGLEAFRPEDSEFFFGREALTQKLVEKIQTHLFLAVLGASGSGKSSLVMAGLIPALDSNYAIFRPGSNPLAALESALSSVSSVEEKSLIVVDQFEELFTLTRDKATRDEFIIKLLAAAKQYRVVLTLRSDFLSEVASNRTLNEEVQNHLENVPPMDKGELGRAIEGQAGRTGLRFESDLDQQALDDVENEPGAMPLLQHALWELWNRRHGRWLRANEYRAFGGVKHAITNTAEKVYKGCTTEEKEQIRDIFLRLTRLDDNDERRDTHKHVRLDELFLPGTDTSSIAMLIEKLANARLIIKTTNKDKVEIEVTHEALIRYWDRLHLWLNEDRENLRLRESISDESRHWEMASRDEAFLVHRGGRLEDAVSLQKNSRYRLNTIELAYLNACIALKNRAQYERERRLRLAVVASVIVAFIFLALGSFGLVKSNEATNAQAVAEEQAGISRAGELAAQSETLSSVDTQQSLLLALEAMGITPQHLPRVEQALLDGLYTVNGARLSGHKEPVITMAVSSNGNLLATGSRDGVVLLWDLTDPSLKTFSLLEGHTDAITTIAFSSDSRWLATGSLDATTRLWDIHDLSVGPLVLYGHADSVKALAFSPDGYWLASGSADTTILLWNLRSKNISEKSIQLAGQHFPIVKITFSPNGKWLALNDGREAVWLWGINSSGSSSNPIKLTHQGRKVTAFIFSPNSDWVATAGDDNVTRLWKLETISAAINTCVILYGHQDEIVTLAFSPDNHWLATGGMDKTVRLWDMTSNNIQQSPILLQSHEKAIYALAFSPSSRWLATGNIDGTTDVWDITSITKDKSPITIILSFHGNRGKINTITFSPDEHWLISTSSNHIAQVWNLKSTDPTQNSMLLHDINDIFFASNPDSQWLATSSYSTNTTVHVWDMKEEPFVPYNRLSAQSSVLDAAISPDGTLLATGTADSKIRIWSISNFLYTPVELGIHTNLVNTVTFSPDGSLLASGGSDKRVCLWNFTPSVFPPNPTLIKCLDGHSNWISTLSFSADGRWLATGSGDHTVRLWDLNSEDIQMNSIVLSNNATIADTKFSADSHWLAIASMDSFVQLWNTDDLQSPILLQTQNVSTLDFDPDNQLLITGSRNGVIRLWNLADFNPSDKPTDLQWLDTAIYVLKISPDGRWLAAGGSDTNLYIYDLQAKDSLFLPTYILSAHNGAIHLLAFSSNSRWLATGGDDTTIQLWDLSIDDPEKNVIALKGHDNSISSLSFTPDGHWLISGSLDGTVRYWNMDMDELKDLACKLVGRNFSQKEWTKFFPEEEYRVTCPNLPAGKK